MKRIAWLIFSLSLPGQSLAIIGFDSATSAGSGGFATSLSFPVTVGSGSNRFLAVGVQIRSTLSQAVTSVSRDGQAFTRAVTIDQNTVRSELWYLAGPNTGSASVTILLDEAAKFSSGAIALIGVSQGDPTGVTGTESGTGLTAAITVTTESDDSWLLDSLCWQDEPLLLTPGLSQTERYEVQSGGGGAANSRVTGAGSTRTTTGNGSYSVDYTSSAADDHAYCVVEVKSDNEPTPTHTSTITKTVTPTSTPTHTSTMTPTSSATPTSTPSFTPDGTDLLMVSNRDGNAEIYKVRIGHEGKEVETRLTFNRAADESPVWSPGGNRIFFVSDRSGTRELWMMHSDGTNVRQITFNSGRTIQNTQPDVR